MGSKKIICVIPARLRSSRLPRKVLVDLAGKPLIQWTWEAAMNIPLFDEVVIAVDSSEVAEVVHSFGGRCEMTDERCLNGTERLVELRTRGVLAGDVWVNWQADEPFLSEKVMRDLLQSCEEEGDIWTLKTPLSADKAEDPGICKVVCDCKGNALYFSRSVIPYAREDGQKPAYARHIGLYAYADQALGKIADLGPCELEQSEMLEQLRFLYYGFRIRVHETLESTFGIDFPEHLALANEYVTKKFTF